MGEKFTTKRLTGSALFWLITEKRCTLVTVERGFHWGNPDALGVTQNRTLIEVEVKISMSDFRANAEKNYIKWIEKGHDSPGLPAQYYFLVPPNLVDKVKPELPGFAGLLTADEKAQYTNGALPLKSIVPCPRMKRRRLNARQMIEMARYQTMAFTHEYLINATWGKESQQLEGRRK